MVDGRLGLLELKEQQEDDEEEAYLELQWPDIEKVMFRNNHHTGILSIKVAEVIQWRI